MTESGVIGHWSLKDVIAHVTAYERGLVEWLEAARRGESIEFPDLDDPDVDRRNTVIYSQNRDRPWPDLLEESRQVFQRLLELVRGIPEEELVEPDLTEWFVRPRWQEGRPLWKCIADDSYEHYRQHIPDVSGWLDKVQSGC